MILVCRKEIVRFANEFALVDVDILRRLEEGRLVLELFGRHNSSGGQPRFKSLPRPHSRRYHTSCVPTLLVSIIANFPAFRIYLGAIIDADVCALALPFHFLRFIRNLLLLRMIFSLYFLVMLRKLFVRRVHHILRTLNDILVRSHVFQHWLIVFLRVSYVA